MDSGSHVNRFTELVGHHSDVQGSLPCSAIPSHRLVASKAAFHGETATLDPVCNTSITPLNASMASWCKSASSRLTPGNGRSPTKPPSKRRAASLSEVFAIPSNARVYRACIRLLFATIALVVSAEIRLPSGEAAWLSELDRPIRAQLAWA